jgi:hypothetical protein
MLWRVDLNYIRNVSDYASALCGMRYYKTGQSHTEKQV